MKKIFSLLDLLTGIIFPKKCAMCGEIIEDDKDLCEICTLELEKIDHKNRCLVCGMHKPHCQCKYRVYYFEECVGVFENRDLAKTGYYRYKIGGLRQYSEFFSKQIAKVIKETFCDINFDAVCPVPQSHQSRLSRGFDHTGRIAREVAEILDIPYRGDIIGAKAFKKSQHNLKFGDRADNVRGKYYIKKRADRMNILLIDDIRTSGATLNECSHMLLLAGADSVRCATALVTVPKNKDILSNGDIKNGN